MNRDKVTRYREGGAEVLETMVQGVAVMEREGVKGRRGDAPERKKLWGPGRGKEYYPAVDTRPDNYNF